MTELLQRLLPILLLICLGIVGRETKLLNEEVVRGLKNIIVKIALPAILFTSFGQMDLEVNYLLLFLLIFLYCVVLYLLGEGLQKLLPKTFNRSYTGGYFTGFEFGMIGVGLFGAIWGMDQLPVIMLIGFGHELFIWFVYVPLISLKSKNSFSLGQTIKDFLKTPTIIAIILGVIFNVLKVYDGFGQTLIGGSIYATLGFLTPLTSPIILIVIGFSMTFKHLNIKEAVVYIGARWVAVLSLGIPLLLVIQGLIPNLNPLFPQAFFAFILLPAPYILPLFIEDVDQAEFYSQLLVYSTVTSFIGYILLLWLSLNG